MSQALPNEPATRPVSLPRFIETGAADPNLAGTALALRGLTKAFDGRAVVDAVTLDVPAGSFFGLVGPERRRQDHHACPW